MTPRLTFDAADARRLRDWAAATPTQEICGLLLGEPDRVYALAPSPNRHPDPARGFAICDRVHAAAQRRARARGLGVMGCYHSHPSGDAAPSDTDVLAAHEDGFVWVILTPTGDMTAWRAQRHGGVKYFLGLALSELEMPAQQA